MLNDPRAAALACLCQYSMDMGLTPVDAIPDPRLLADGYEIKGHIAGIDEVLAQDVPVCYGYLAQKIDDGSFVLVTRGTSGGREWYVDVLGKPTGHPLGGQVEEGFWSDYVRFSFLKLGAGARGPLVHGVAAVVGQAPLVVVGHSLGAATATYAALDLAVELGSDKVSAALFASPRPGNAEFAAVFEQYCPSYVSYAFHGDAVPHLPSLGAHYINLPKTRWYADSERQARIAYGVGAAHHVCGYAASLYYALKDWEIWGGAQDADVTACILGPAASLPASSSQ